MQHGTPWCMGPPGGVGPSSPQGCASDACGDQVVLGTDLPCAEYVLLGNFLEVLLLLL